MTQTKPPKSLANRSKSNGNDAGSRRKPKPPATKTSRTRETIPWSAIQADYERGEISIAKLAERHGVSRSAIFKRRQRENWPQRSQPSNFSQSELDTNAKRAKLAPQSSEPSLQEARSLDRATLVQRLYHAFDHQVAELEARFATVETPSEEEKMARTLSTLARTLVQLINLEGAHDQGSEEQDSDVNDLDRLYSELTQRVDRLRRTRDAS